MKILIISEVYPNETNLFRGIYIKQQADELKKIGYKIDVLTPCRGNKFDGHFIDENGTFKFDYRTTRYELFLSCGSSKLKNKLSEFVTANGYDLIAVHLVSDLILKIAIDCCKEAQVPLFVHFHGLNVWTNYKSKHPLRESFYACRRKRILNHATGIVGVSNKVVNIIRERIKSVPVYCVYNGVDNVLFAPNKRTKNNYTIISIGNLIPTKGFDLLLHAFSNLQSYTKSYNLVIIGDGPERKKLEDIAMQLKIEDKVSFYGNIAYDQVPTHLSNSYVFALCSFYEALGCVYLEAMSSGLPIIGVNGTGIDEVVCDGKEGFLVNPMNVSEVTEALITIIEDKNLHEKMRHYSLSTSKKYSWKNSAMLLDSIYRKAINK